MGAKDAESKSAKVGMTTALDDRFDGALGLEWDDKNNGSSNLSVVTTHVERCETCAPPGHVHLEHVGTLPNKAVLRSSAQRAIEETQPSPACGKATGQALNLQHALYWFQLAGTRTGILNIRKKPTSPEPATILACGCRLVKKLRIIPSFSPSFPAWHPIPNLDPCSSPTLELGT